MEVLQCDPGAKPRSEDCGSRPSEASDNPQIKLQPGIERVQALADISRSRYVAINATRAPIANPPNSAQLGRTPTILPSYMRECAWVCYANRQTHRQTDVRDHYTFRVVYDSTQNVQRCGRNQNIIVIILST